jgi:hypothetical protein
MKGDSLIHGPEQPIHKSSWWSGLNRTKGISPLALHSTEALSVDGYKVKKKINRTAAAGTRDLPETLADFGNDSRDRVSIV